MDAQKMALDAAKRMGSKYGIKLTFHKAIGGGGFEFSTELKSDNGLLGAAAEYANTLKRIALDFKWDSGNLYRMRTNPDVDLEIEESRSGLVLTFQLFPKA